MISVIVPFYNEKENLGLLSKKLTAAFKEIKDDFEIIFVDDGSTDGSASVLKPTDEKIKLISQRKRFGKGRALSNGFSASSGDVIVFMDADLQDDPEEISRFIKTIKRGYDLVNGWRKDRKDPLSKIIPSAIFNFFLLKILFRTKFHDINCGYKALRRELLEQIPLYGDNYRFLPLIAEKEGFKTTEIVVKHNPRLHGKSKYGFLRLFFGFFDTIGTYFIYEFAEKPIHFFGPVGIAIFFIGFVISLYLAIERIFYGVLLYKRPILNLGILLIIVGIQIVLTGIIGELIVYLNKKNK